jgi:nucleoside-diphosphate-sugar epimerase
MTLAFVTGGSGFVGRTLIAMLRSRGAAVRALARSASAEAAVRSQGADPVRGDLHDVAAMRAGMTGCDVVFHAAAIVDEWGDERQFERVNVQGTANVLEAARSAGVTRVVHVSTEAVLAGSGPLVRVDETTPRPAQPYGPYPRTKGRAEDAVLAANAPGFAAIVVRPRFVWGKGDTSVLPKVVAAVRAGRFRWIEGGRYLTSTTHVRNVCEGLILAAERGRGGEIYFVTDGEPIEFRTFLSRLLETQHVTPGGRSLPRGLARTIAAAVERIWTLLGLKIAPPVTRMSVKMIGEEVTIDDSKARRELGYEGLVTVDEGLREMRDGAS